MRAIHAREALLIGTHHLTLHRVTLCFSLIGTLWVAGLMLPKRFVGGAGPFQHLGPGKR